MFQNVDPYDRYHQLYIAMLLPPIDKMVYFNQLQRML